MMILSRVNIAFFLSKDADLKGIKVMIRDLDDVLFRDVGGKIAADGRYTAISLTFYLKIIALLHLYIRRR